MSAHPYLAGLLIPLLFTLPAAAGEAEVAARAIALAAKNGEFEKVRGVITELGRSTDEKAPNVIFGAFALVPPHEIMAESINAFIALGPDKIAPAFDDLLKKKKPNELILATVVAVAEKITDARAEAWLVRGIESHNYFVYRNAIAPLVERRSKLAIPALIDLLEKVGFAPSTESYLARDGLIALTGLDYATLAEWREFWKLQGETFDPKQLDEAQKGRTGVERKRSGDFKVPKFFDVEVHSDHVVFVVDVSGSMQMYDDDGEKIGEGPDHKTKERLARAKHNLIDALSNLPKYSHFNIITYSGWNKLFSPKGSVPADAAWKKKAIEFVENLRADGPTHTDDALAEAFKDTTLDTIFLLSDGAPTREGKKTKELIPQILEQVQRLNRLPRVKIFTFGYEGEGKWPHEKSKPTGKPDPDAPTPQDLIDFLKKLAEQNGGKYTPVK